MNGVANEIGTTIIRILPVTYQAWLFSEKISLNDIISQILIECCEYAYFTNAEKTSLWKHRKDREIPEPHFAEDHMRMRLQRAASYMNLHNEKLYNFVKNEYGFKTKEHAFDKIEKHYSINSLQFLELINIDDIELIKVIMDRKFLSAKFFNDDFRSCANNYDYKCSMLRDQGKSNSENTVLSSLAMFTLEWQFYLDFLYELVDNMEKNHIKEIPDMKDRLIAFCYEPTIVSALSYFTEWQFPGELTCISRAILLRRKFVNEIVSKVPGEEYALTQASFLEALYITELIPLIIPRNEISLKEWFVKNTNIDDWASVLKEYDVFQTFIPNKIWTNKKIRYAKSIYKELTFDFDSV